MAESKLKGEQAFFGSPLNCRVQAYRSGSNQSLTAGDFSTVIFNSEDQDAGSDYNTTTGIFTCPEDGLYLVHAGCRFDVDTSGDYLTVDIYQESTVRARRQLAAPSTDPVILDCTVIIYCSANDEIRVEARNTDNNDNLTFGRDRTYLHIARLG